MQRVLVALAIALTLGGWASGTAAQVPSGGYYSGGAYYAPSADPYWPTNNETAYDYGVYAYAPGFGPYLRLGGESGWNPNIGTTYNSYPPGNYYTDYGLPYIGVPSNPFLARYYRAWPGPTTAYCWPAYPFCR
jgi:hypothetical protein